MLPLPAPARQLGVVDEEVEAARLGVDRDAVAVAHQRDRTAVDSLGGHMGDVRRTVRNLEVVKVEAEHNLLYVKGGVPGPTGGYLFIEKAKAARQKVGSAKTQKKIEKKA